MSEPWSPHNKRFLPYGLAAEHYTTAKRARGMMYTTAQDTLPPTRIIFDDNPYNDIVEKAKVILDFGCGIGRNLPFIMENTSAHYIGVEPNASALQYFWTIQNNPDEFEFRTDNWEQRVTLLSTIAEITQSIDVVISTFVMMHLHTPPPGIMGPVEMVNEIRQHTHPGTVWIFYEHEREKAGWQQAWLDECGIIPQVYKKDYIGWEELTHRGTDHHLIIWKE